MDYFAHHTMEHSLRLGEAAWIFGGALALILVLALIRALKGGAE